MRRDLAAVFALIGTPPDSAMIEEIDHRLMVPQQPDRLATAGAGGPMGMVGAWIVCSHGFTSINDGCPFGSAAGSMA